MKWEYEIITLGHFLNSDKALTTQEKLNEYGKDGWEFIGRYKSHMQH